MAPYYFFFHFRVTKMTSNEIYDEIVEEYSQAKSNPYKHYVEEPTFWSCAGKDFSGKTVLDLACGSGHYSRQFRIYGAHQVNMLGHIKTKSN